MPEFCEVAWEKLVNAILDRANLLAITERTDHECLEHRDPHACQYRKTLTKTLAEDYRYVSNLVEDLKGCILRPSR